MEKSNVTKIIIGFFMLIVGIVLISAVANGSDLVTGKVEVENEAIDLSAARTQDGASINITTSNYTIANVPISWKVTDCPPDAVTYGNTTEDWISGTDYEFYASTGTLQILNTSTTAVDAIGGNSTLLGYQYCPDAYINIAWGRSVINLVAGFFALAIMGVGLGLFYSVAKDAGLLSN